MCDPVARALYHTELRNVTFRDLGCIRGLNIPALSVFHLRDADAMEIHPENVRPLAVGVFQVLWKYPYEEYPVPSRLGIRRNLEHEIGMYSSAHGLGRVSLT